MQVRGIYHLIEGYHQFRNKFINNNSNEHAEFERLVAFGQNPKILMIACCDSRVDPAIVLNCSPGDLFVMRNVANLVPPCEEAHLYNGTSAALEYAILVLQVQHVIIFGHSKCGGITSLFADQQNPNIDNYSFINEWMTIAADAKKHIDEQHSLLPQEQQIDLCSKYSIIKSLANLNSFSWINEKVKEQCLFIHGWYFDMEKGIIEEYNPFEHKFTELKLNNITYDINDLKI